MLEAAVALLFVLGCLGATDIVFYHSLSHGIRSHAESRFELWIHSLRGPIYATMFLVLPNFAFAGGWVVAVYALLVLDVAVTVIDFSLEGASREKLGGLPSGEYVLHMLIGMTFGAFAATTVASTYSRLLASTAIRYQPCVGMMPQLVLAGMAALVFYSGILDAAAARRLGAAKAGHEKMSFSRPAVTKGVIGSG
jgi:hypothetical protein